MSRSSPTLLDLGIALAAGAAGAYALSRTDVSDALPGVAVAIALVPPLAVVGITAQLGSYSQASGALILFTTNALAILAMGALTFVMTGVAATETDRDWNLDRWFVALGALAVVVMGALLVNTSRLAQLGAETSIATQAVQDWIADRDFTILAVMVDAESVEVVVTGPGIPEDTAALADALDAALGWPVAVDLQIALTDRLQIEMD